MNMTRSVTSAIPLLDLHNEDDTKPLLPLSSDDPLAFENSPLATVRPLGANASNVVSDLLGPGPWPVRAVLQLPADCGLLHPTSRSGDSSIHITHALRFTMRLSRGDDPAMDSKTTSKRKRYDVVVRAPVHILSVRFRFLSLPFPKPSADGFPFIASSWGTENSVLPARSTPRCRATLRRSTKARRWRRLRLRVRVPPNANDARARAIGRGSKRARFSPRRRSAWTIRTSCWRGRSCTSASCLDTRACWATLLRRTTLDLTLLIRMRLILPSYLCDFEFRSHGSCVVFGGGGVLYIQQISQRIP